ncbi:G-type lectin S-receptor-like serine/threonine-protein kinase At4g27290 [Sesamum indicum]|uniref:Receptor-like serine/threonine-protein kinase n=1 Tax=Sesamum indicum TaxID=4182 RepID=A0A6I9UT21_SESIN|nr:G-type lectin S-receptor-like serine/threonine-protein kinase At4g27290 [Sesamum indicum]
MKTTFHMDSSWKCFFSLLIIFPLILQLISAASDTINATRSIRDGETLVSSGGRFELGFFSPGNSSNRYLGLWFKNLTVTTIVWVANREVPLTNRRGILRVVEPGLLVLLNDTDGVVWSSNTSRAVQNPVAQLLDDGNIVVRDVDDESPENLLWQSFDHPTDTYLPGMKFGRNLVTGLETYYLSWRTSDDPAPGEFSFHLDPTGYPQILLKKSADVVYRIGPWNGIRFSGTPNAREDPTYRLLFVMNETEVTYREDTIDRSVVSRFTVNPNGVAQRLTWVDRTQGWATYMNMPADICDTYKLCGAYGRCNIANSPSCGCLERFVPKDPQAWVGADWSNGCIRRANLSCQGDIFLRYSGIKLPDSRNSWYNKSMTLDECRTHCSRNCSCTAYTQLNMSSGSGCLFWLGDLVDIRSLSPDGQDIYIRMASSESDSKGKNRVVLIASLASAVGVILIGLSLFLCILKRTNNQKQKKEVQYSPHDKDSELPLFNLSVITKATNNFSMNNKLGEGGFGPVYKGILEEGQEIAVKRLSKDSMQGLDEFKNEVIFIAKLQHRNLVRLLGCCIQEEETMLIYEYMPNKSLDVILFDQTRSKLLDWQTRFNIINGIARGLLYLHQDSRLRIIHRDLKASNILLDSDMNPKISDFGMARSFGGNETEAKTRRVVGTYGYMSPEYAVDGLFSVKSDVFSFGVLVLEIVSGRRNRGFSHSDHNLNLLGHAWTLYKEGRQLELVDSCLGDSFYFSEVVRSIHVGLLCVQQNPEDRPTMSSVVLMLGNEGVFPEAKQPGFFTERDVLAAQSATSTHTASSANEVTITMPEPR